jgi:choline dehydrogenase-like flavoprotein
MIPDPIVAGLKSGWDVRDCSKLERDLHLEADVAIVGTGAGGGTAAEILSHAGLKVVLVESGALLSSSDFHMLEREAYPQMYQESANRQTKDKAITILQGRTVGGSTTVNWTSSFRTPETTLQVWQQKFGLADYTHKELAPWFAMMEKRLSVAPWGEPPNENNAVLARGAAKLGIPTAIVPRNVKGCWNLGYCGVGCPTNAKQSMLVTTIPGALSKGATLLTRCRAERFTMSGDSVNGLVCEALDAQGLRNTPYSVTITAKTYIAAGGAINTPALLLRSDVPNPHLRLGVRTFLHPVALSAAVMPQPVNGFAGAPQTVYSDHFLETQPVDGPIGYKLEVPPIYPLIYGTITQGFGEKQAALLADLPNKEVMIALMRDGFNDQSEGGKVQLRKDHSPQLDYPITPFVWDGLRRSLLTMAEIQFAAGATSVMPIHESAWPYTSWGQAKAQIAELPMQALLMRVVSAHVMGGCGMGTDEQKSVIDGTGRHHQVDNLFVFDGSAFPTSVGANPQLSIYGMVARNANRLASAMTGKTFAPPLA